MKDRKVYQVTVWIVGDDVSKIIDYSVYAEGFGDTHNIYKVMDEIATLERGKVKDYNYRALFV